MRRLRLFGVIAALAVTATLFTVQPAQAAVGGCNANTSLGVRVARNTQGSFARNIWVKVCYVYDHDSIKNNTYVRCRLDDGVTGCDIRAEVLKGKLDQYERTGAYVKTLSNNFFD